MQPFAQNVAVGATVLFLSMVILRQVPVLGVFVRLAMRVLFLFSPIMLMALAAGLVWFHWGSFFSDMTDDAVASPVFAPLNAPLPTGRPGG